jgi:YD repeat-containing protein
VVRYEGGHVSGTIGPDGPGLLFGIGPGDRLADVTLAADPTQFVRFEYDDDGRLVQAASSSAAPRRFAYDRDSERVTTISDEGGAVLLSVEYDDKDRVTREQDAQGLLDGEAVSYVYEELPDGGMRTTVTYPLSIFEHDWHPVQIAIHDPDSRLRELQLQPTSTQTLIGRYDYDAENRRIVLQDPCRTGSSADPMDGIAGLIRRFFLTLLGIFAR